MMRHHYGPVPGHHPGPSGPLKPEPPRPHGPSPALRAQLERDFGSLRNFERELNATRRNGRKGGWVSLVCTRDGRLRLVRTPPHVPPMGRVLFRLPVSPPGPDHPGNRLPAIHWPAVSERFEQMLRSRPPYPLS